MDNKPIPRDIILYNKIKKEISEKYKHSAYRSALIVKKYKEEYVKKYNRDDAYIGDKPKLSNLQRWFMEDWKNQRGETGYKYKNECIFRGHTYWLYWNNFRSLISICSSHLTKDSKNISPFRR